MIKIALWGAGYIGEKIYTYINENFDDVVIAYWCDSKKSEKCKEKNSIPLIAPDELKRRLEMKEIDYLIISTGIRKLNEIELELQKLKIEEAYYVFRKYYENPNKNHNKNIQQVLEKIDLTRPCLEYFEFHVCDHCNLNCKGCLHLSNLCDVNYADLDGYIRDIKRIKELFWGVQMVKLLGGEPLLNEQLPEFIKATREYIPECDLRVGTNGLLLNRQDKSLFVTMKENDAYFFVSLYPPIELRREDIETVCRENGVDCVFTEKIDCFRKQLYLNKQGNPEQTYEYCKKLNGYCFGLREGKLSPCVSFYVKFMNKFFDSKIEIGEDDEIDLYTKGISAWDMIDRLYKPIPLCEYCGKAKEFKWESGRKKALLSDYIVGEKCKGIKQCIL